MERDFKIEQVGSFAVYSPSAVMNIRCGSLGQCATTSMTDKKISIWFISSSSSSPTEFQLVKEDEIEFTSTQAGNGIRNSGTITTASKVKPYGSNQNVLFGEGLKVTSPRRSLSALALAQSNDSNENISEYIRDSGDGSIGSSRSPSPGISSVDSRSSNSALHIGNIHANDSTGELQVANKPLQFTWLALCDGNNLLAVGSGDGEVVVFNRLLQTDSASPFSLR